MGNTPRGYLGLVRRFRLQPIRSDIELKKASDIIDELLDRRLTRAEDAYLEVLGLLVETYESAHDPIEPASDREVLVHLIEARGVSQREVARRCGIAVSTLSELVSGKRTMNRSHIEKLAKYFSVEPGVFLGTDQRESPKPEREMEVRMAELV